MEDLTRFHYRLVHEGPRGLFESLFWWCLVPLSLIYGGVAWLRNILYDFALKQSYRSSLPIVSVGNITAGGTGKTPVVDLLIKKFQQQGQRPAVVSRGYGGRCKDAVGIVSDGEAILMTSSVSGDEPFLLAKKNPGCPVLVAKKRSDAVKLIERKKWADLVILDDGFQHRGLRRDADIVLLDTTQPLGNGWPLPAGNLREFSTGLDRAHILIMTKGEDPRTESFRGKKTFHSQFVLSDEFFDLDDVSVGIDSLVGKRVLAFSGIANPNRFFTDLERKGMDLVRTVPLADHVDYRNSDVIRQLTMSGHDADIMVTTEKDAVKLTSSMFKLPCYYAPLSITINGFNDLDVTLNSLLWRN